MRRNQSAANGLGLRTRITQPPPLVTIPALPPTAPQVTVVPGSTFAPNSIARHLISWLSTVVQLVLFPPPVVTWYALWPSALALAIRAAARGTGDSARPQGLRQASVVPA